MTSQRKLDRRDAVWDRYVLRGEAVAAHRYDEDGDQRLGTVFTPGYFKVFKVHRPKRRNGRTNLRRSK